MSENINFIPYEWNDCTFWYNPDVKTFEIYASPTSRFNFYIYRVADLYFVEMTEFGETMPMLIVNEIPMFRDLDLTSALALACILFLEDFHSLAFKAEDNNLMDKVIFGYNALKENPPEWIKNFEDLINQP